MVENIKRVKTRKILRCELCGRRIPKGFHAYFYSGITDNHEFCSSYFCNTCHTLAEEFPVSVTDFWEGYFDSDTLHDSMSDNGVHTPLQLLNVLRKKS